MDFKNPFAYLKKSSSTESDDLKKSEASSVVRRLTSFQHPNGSNKRVLKKQFSIYDGVDRPVVKLRRNHSLAVNKIPQRPVSLAVPSFENRTCVLTSYQTNFQNKTDTYISTSLEKQISGDKDFSSDQKAQISHQRSLEEPGFDQNTKGRRRSFQFSAASLKKVFSLNKLSNKSEQEYSGLENSSTNSTPRRKNRFVEENWISSQNSLPNLRQNSLESNCSSSSRSPTEIRRKPNFEKRRCDSPLTLKSARDVSEAATHEAVSVYYTTRGPIAFLYQPNARRCTYRNCSQKAILLAEQYNKEYKASNVCQENTSASTICPPRRLRCRRLAVSAPGSVDDPGSVVTDPSTSSPPHFEPRRYTCGDEQDLEGGTITPKKGSIRVTRFISSLHKSSLHGSKSKAGKFAAAAVLATYMTQSQSDKETGSNILCETCPSDDAKSNLESTKTEDFIELLEKMQSTRMDEQRCWFHMTAPAIQEAGNSLGENSPNYQYPTISKVLSGGAPFPQIIAPVSGGYWIEGFDSTSPSLKLSESQLLAVENVPESNLIKDDTKHAYRDHFIGKEHYNLTAYDSSTNSEIGAMVLSVKFESVSKDEKINEDKAVELKKKTCGQCRVILRCELDSWTEVFPITPESTGPIQWVKRLCPNIDIDGFQPVIAAETWQNLLQFDEHTIQPSSKFGLLLQSYGQTKEEELFGNQIESPAFSEFLSFLGDRVDLQGFTGFRGGLDVANGHTGLKSLYTNFRGREIMFHVSTMLPFVDGDRQQLQRKRHIGNDIVAVVFQESNTPFVPNMITTRFLHAYIVIQPIDACTENVRYKVSVTGRSDVPTFGPEMPQPAVFKKTKFFRDWLYCKLINAETHCYKSEKFAQMHQRTRTMLIKQLYKDLREGTDLLLDHRNNLDSVSLSSASSETVSNSNKEAGTNFFETFKKLTNKHLKSSDEVIPTAISPKNETQPSKSEGKTNFSEKSEVYDVSNDATKSQDFISKNENGNNKPSNNEQLKTGSSQSLNGSIKATINQNSPISFKLRSCYTSLDSDTRMESIASSSQTNLLPHSGRKSDINKKSESVETKPQPETNEMKRIRAENEILQKQRQDNEKQITILRNEVKKLRLERYGGVNSHSKRQHTHDFIKDEVTKTTKEHLV